MSNVIDRGLLITLEGLDRAGKTTQAKLLENYLNSMNKPAKIIRFPGLILKKKGGFHIFYNKNREKHVGWTDNRLIFERKLQN